MSIITNLLSSFILGLLTPTTAVCVLPLYPGFLAYLTSRVESEKKKKNLFIILGFLIILGVVSFMLLTGIIFTSILQVSLTKIIGIISPIAFLVLGIISILLILNYDLGKFLPKFKNRKINNVYLNAFSFGFFFGAIVIPCNPLFIAALFTKSLLDTSFFLNLLNFIMFGLGIGAPLLVLAIVSQGWSSQIINFLIKYKGVINRLSGIIMLVISLYYFIFVFRVFGLWR